MWQKNNTGFVKAQSDNLPKVTVLMVSDFFAESDVFNIAETRGVKAKKAEGENYGDPAVRYVELRREKSLCHIRGKVCPEHRVNNKAYTISMLVNEETERVEYIRCEDCAASECGCKHAIAFLMWVHRRSKEPEPTATVCYWKKPRLAQVGANVRSMKAKDLIPSKQTPVLPNSTGFLQTVLQEMEKRNFDCQLSRHFVHVKSHTDLSMHSLMLKFYNTSTCKDADSFLNFASSEIDIESCKKVAKDTIHQSESTLWKEVRYERITASRIYEVSHCKTPQGSLVEQIIGAFKIRDTDAMERGRRLEQEVVKILEENLQITLHRSGLLLNPNFPVIGASPDAVAENFVVEIKCPFSLKSEERYITKDNRIGNKYFAQIQLQMFMQNVKIGYFCMAKHDFETSQSIIVICVNYDEQFVMEIINNAMTFWKQNVFPLLLNGVAK
ncbi:uncharacterized protein LOC120359056 [Solenopsis invicta]|uniref:uncharacterized protein LOC120359056 n=1 Tax=Solenopsis invicta TaxID=13686 RepID=UPI00193D9BE0|nr:uncharacterized protein LOC120359056 [Solenopsis invicta]